jgi:antitoxin component of MazEF toxin-antitoxin module
MNEGSDLKEITKTWLTGNSSCALVIPKNLAKEYRLDSPTHVVIEKRPDGLLIRKLEIV